MDRISPISVIGMKAQLFVLLVLFSIFSLSTLVEAACGKFFHASCQIDFEFLNTPCTKVYHDVVENFQYCCAEKKITPNYRNYKLLGNSSSSLTVNGQITFTNGYVDFQDFTFTQVGANCKASGCSMSNSVSVYDYCANYCNLRNLVRGFGYTINERIGICSYIPNSDAKCPFIGEMDENVPMPIPKGREDPKDTYCNNQ